ncbi:MAG: glycosyltransferase [Candidatus Parcubacteria bacterium]|nr:glycosyltransferase [Candidatus Parcubacteria bacterium]
MFVFPSTTETFGNVTIEAMASGLVPVVANAGGSMSLVKDGENGFLTIPKDPKDFSQKIDSLLNNSGIREKMKKIALVFSKDFTWGRVFDKLFRMYIQLLENKN